MGFPTPDTFLSEIQYVSSSPEETIGLGARIASLLQPGAIIALRGSLGVGKTCLVKGIAQGLGIREEVTSPTYTIIAEYQGLLPFYHIDAYRLNGDEDFAALGAEELLYGGGISVIEWSERIPGSIPPEALIVELGLLDGERRTIRIRGAALPPLGRNEP